MIGTKHTYTRPKQRTLNTYFTKSVFSTNLANTGKQKLGVSTRRDAHLEDIPGSKSGALRQWELPPPLRLLYPTVNDVCTIFYVFVLQ